MGKVTGPPFIETETPNEFVGATDPILRARVHGDLFDRVVILANGTVLSGSGGTAPTAVGFAPAGSIPLSIIDAAGDLIVGSGADTAARLAKGSPLTVLRTNAGGTALEWADISALFDAAGAAAALVSDTAYDATTWNGDTTHAPSKNAVRDKIESMSAGAVSDAAYNEATWNGDTTTAPSKNAVRDKIESLSGASAPGASRWLGPCKIGCFDGQNVGLADGYDADGGTFTLTHDGHTTTPLAVDANAATIKAALEALTGIGTGNVDVTAGGDFGTGGFIYVVFHDALAVELMTVDVTNLTGPSAPYTATAAGTGGWVVPMFTPAVGDIIEDFLHKTVTAFTEGGRLDYTDNPDDAQGAAPDWSVPVSAEGVDGLDLSSASVGTYTNFSGLGSNDPDSQSSALNAVIVAGIANQSGAGHASEGFYGVLPTVVGNAVPIYSAVYNVAPAPTAGEVWIWVKTATPTAISD